MTVNELITKLDLLPADAEVHLDTFDGGGSLRKVILTEDGDVVVLTGSD